jgi:hypothetical protein
MSVYYARSYLLVMHVGGVQLKLLSLHRHKAVPWDFGLLSRQIAPPSSDLHHYTTMAEFVLGDFAPLLELFSKALETFEQLEPKPKRRLVPSFRGKSKTAIDGPEVDEIRSDYGVAVTRLQDLLATDIQHQLSNADFARIENLGKSSLVLGTIAFAEIEQAKRKRKPDTSFLLEAIKFATELTAHIRVECERLEK